MERLTRVGNVEPVQARDVVSSPLGIGFEKLDRGVFDPEKAYDKVAAIGVKWVRIQSGWARTERAKGVYDFAWIDTVVDNLRARGLVPWVCLCYGNGLYDERAAKVFGAVGVPPIFTEEQKQAWHRYVVAFAQHFRGRVQWYEVWNEPDGVWCWKHGPNGSEYGAFVVATAAAVRQGDPTAKLMGGSTCLRDLAWLTDVFATGAAECIDWLTYHAYDPDERLCRDRVSALRALCKLHNPKLEVVQGETGAQSRSDGAGALAGGAWTPRRQAKFVARHVLADLLDGMPLTSYFSSLDMIEALNGTVGNKASYLDYGYFGVLGADFDGDGIATGEYTPKPSYRTLQALASIFREDFSATALPLQFRLGVDSRRTMMREDLPTDLVHGGFRKPNGSAAFVYWKSTNLMTTDYEATVSLQSSGLPADVRLVDLLDGTVYTLPPSIRQDAGRGVLAFAGLPLRDYPLLLAFGDFLVPCLNG